MDLTRLDPVKLRHLVAIVDAGSFAGAAEGLGISQPAISKSVRALEEVVETQLFERGRAGARPTRYADLLAGHARVILAEYRLAGAELQSLRQANAQQIAIGASLSLTQTLLPAGIAAFRRRWPDVAITVDVGFSEQLLADLSDGRLDLVLSAPEGTTEIGDRLGRTFLLEERDALIVGATHPLLSMDRAGLSDLLAYPWIVPRRSGRLDRIHAIFAKHGLPPPANILRAESGDLARGLLRQGSFICLMGEGVLRADIVAGQVAVLPDAEFAATRAAFLFTRTSTRSRPPLRNLATVLLDMARGQAAPIIAKEQVDV